VTEPAVEGEAVEADVLTLDYQGVLHRWATFEACGWDARTALELALDGEPNLTDAERDLLRREVLHALEKPL
jgi:hypothetical protein